MDAIDEETKETILRNIGDLFPNVSDLSFFRQVFDSENWDLDKSLQTIKLFLEDADRESTDDASRTNKNLESGASDGPKQWRRSIINAATNSGTNASRLSGYSTAAQKNNSTKTGTIPKSSNVTKENKKVTPAGKLSKKEIFKQLYNDALQAKNPVHRISSLALAGIKVMIIMRGCPGSGKTFLVNHLATSLSRELSKAQGNTFQTDPIDHHIFSADDFWINPRTGKYVFNSEFIEFAHLWNQKLVRQVASEGRSPIFIDNTHTRMWEMQKVVTIAVEFGYVIEIIEPPNKWALNENELVRRNVHGVHKDAIKRMLDRYEHHVTPSKIMSSYNLSYSTNLIPPQKCLVSFSTPPSKNQLKIFNARFYCVPLDSILLLKQGTESSADDGGSITANSLPVNNLPFKLKKDVIQTYPMIKNDGNNVPLLDGFNSRLNENQCYTNNLNKHSKAQAKFSNCGDILMPLEAPTKPSVPQPGLKTSQFDAVQSSHNHMPTEPSHPFVDGLKGLPDSSVDLLLSLDEKTLKALLDQVTTPQMLPTNQAITPQQMPTEQSKTPQPPTDHVVTPQQHASDQPTPKLLATTNITSSREDILTSKSLNADILQNKTNNSSGSSFDLLSFEEDDVDLLSSSHNPPPTAQHSRGLDVLEPSKTPLKRSNLEVYSDESVISDDDSISESSTCVNVQMPSPFEACDEFGFDTTREYILVQPDGSLKYQYYHEGYPNYLNELTYASRSGLLTKTLLLNKKISNASDREVPNVTVLSKLRELVKKPFIKNGQYIDDMSTSFETPPDSVSRVSDEADVTAMSTDGRKSDRIEQMRRDDQAQSTSSMATPSANTSNLLNDSSNNFESGHPASLNTWKENPLQEKVPSHFFRSSSPKDQRAPAFTYLGSERCSVQPLGATVDSIKTSFQSLPCDKGLSSDCSTKTIESNLPDPVATWNKSDVEENTPRHCVRSTSPKAQRSLTGRSSKPRYEFWSNTNYLDFDTLSKANAGTYDGNGTILLGRASRFRSGTSPQKYDDIKMVATHEKSSMTSAESPMVEKGSGIDILTRMFPGASVDGLEELFEKCQKDLDWTVNLMMDSGLEISESFIADGFAKLETNASQSHTDDLPLETDDYKNGAIESVPSQSNAKKMKKSKCKLTEEYMNLVKEFEGNFVMNEDCYSDRLKKVKETKFGKSTESCTVDDDHDTRDSTPSNDLDCFSDSTFDDDEGDMSFVMPKGFFTQLQDKFGGVPMLFGEELVVKLPVSLARQVYSYALDSICQHMEDQQNVIDLLIKEDEAFARKLQEAPSTKDGVASFQEIMDYEMALRTHKKQQGAAGSSNEATFASTLSHQLLAERFPNMDPATLKVVLEDTNQSLHEATNLLASAGHVPVDPIVLETPKSIPNEPDYKMTREESIHQANAYHEVAVKLNELREHYLIKAQQSYRNGNHAVAMFYRELFNWYSDRIKESNSMAAKAMLHGNEEATTLDLHFLAVAESVRVLDLFLDEGIRQLKTRKREIFIITGRGLHSSGGKSKIKPAIKQRLRQRGLKFSEINPGMLKTVINKSSTVSYKLDKFQ